MSNNRLWKRKLQDKIDRHNHRHGRKPKGVSNKTMHERASSLFRSFGLLRRLGFSSTPTVSLAGISRCSLTIGRATRASPIYVASTVWICSDVRTAQPTFSSS